LACGTQSADEKLLNRRYRTGALTSAPGSSEKPIRASFARMQERSPKRLDFGHKKLLRQLLGRSAGSDQLDHLPPKLWRISNFTKEL
jgi:hypothetical protein